MRNSRRIKRMSRNRFFLLVNSGSVEILDAPKEMTLPESRVETKPRETVVIFVSKEQVLVQGQAVALVEDILNGETEAVDPITWRLAELKENVVGPSTLAVADSLEVTILADRSVPFTVIRQIMSTCTGEGYENVSLAVIQKASQVAAR
jgi:biopolymer transport protein ExbD